MWGWDKRAEYHVRLEGEWQGWEEPAVNMNSKGRRDV